ncbi:MAG: mechanosensitive ion channel family protein [Deltaproteobacteria bacterium]|nr:mechanosensitive ion channel family protein [Deltaproteobacteria bacterium]
MNIKEYMNIIVPTVIFFLTFVSLFIIRYLILQYLKKLSKKTETKADDIVLDSIKTPSFYWLIAISIYVTISFANIPQELNQISIYLTKAVYIIIIISITLAIANMSGRLLKDYVQSSNLSLPTTGLAYTIIKGVIILLGFLIVLNYLGISITPLITALGVGGLAVALALQDTLSNLFAGIHIMVEKSVRVGDFIRLENGLEGYVEDISWRTTRIKTLANNIIVIPNNKLSQSIITNYYLPEKSMAILITVGVSYNSDIEKVERILLEVGREVTKNFDFMNKNFEPLVRLNPGFTHSSLEFTLIISVSEVTYQFVAMHEARKLIIKKFRENGIEIPYQQTVVHLKTN